MSAQIDTRRAYSGRVINVDLDRVRFPDGSEGELEMVRHPGASAVVPFASDPMGPDPQVLLIRQYRYASEQFMYEIPAGRLDPGEDPATCAKRELREETGCHAEHVELLTTIYTTPGFIDERIHLFMATGLTHGDADRELDEFIEVETLTISRCLAMIQSGEISDGKTIIALMYAAGFRLG
ncbi:MAG: NUDIX hydrolase [Gemmatimonadetes bacterium]|nr:NUDIX hydrolase [Gemmatimonadota bacterium]